MPINVAWRQFFAHLEYFAEARIELQFRGLSSAVGMRRQSQASRPPAISFIQAAVCGCEPRTFLIRTGVAALPAESGDQRPVPMDLYAGSTVNFSAIDRRRISVLRTIRDLTGGVRKNDIAGPVMSREFLSPAPDNSM